MRKHNKILSVFLAVLLLISAMSVTAFAADGGNTTLTAEIPCTVTLQVGDHGKVTVNSTDYTGNATLSVSFKFIGGGGTDTYTVTFNANGHGTAPASQTVLSGNKATEPGAPTASGWTFGGWYKDSACTETQKYDFNTPVTSNLTLYAKWTEDTPVTPPAPASYTVSFNMSGHGTQITGQTVEDGGKATKPADPIASGYTFKGWYTDSTFQTAFDFGTAIHADTTLYAKWVVNSVPADPSSPQTGDNSHLFLWITLLIISSAALTVTAIYGRKRKNTN